MQPETAKRLRDALDAAIEIRDIVTAADTQASGQQCIRQLAIERLLAIVGEAVNRAAQSDESLEQSMPDARKIVGMRNRIIHGYDEIQEAIVWDAAQSHIPKLITQLQTLLSRSPDPDA